MVGCKGEKGDLERKGGVLSRISTVARGGGRQGPKLFCSEGGKKEFGGWKRPRTKREGKPTSPTIGLLLGDIGQKRKREPITLVAGEGQGGGCLGGGRGVGEERIPIAKKRRSKILPQKKVGQTCQ